MKKIIAIGMCVAMMFTAVACGNTDGYQKYKEAYQAMTKPGSLDVNLSLELVTADDTIVADGNMKMNKDGNMYYEMTVGDTEVVQFTKDGTLYCEIDGVKSSYSTSGKNERPKEDGGNTSKEERSGFEITAFMEEFATMLEAGKIKEMGLLDPISEAAVKSVEVKEASDGTEYVLDVPESFVEKLFNIMIEEQVSDEAFALSFSNLENFSCTMHSNKDGILDKMKYSGITDVTVPEALTGKTEEVIPMEITLSVEILNPGTAIEIPEMSTEGYE